MICFEMPMQRFMELRQRQLQLFGRPAQHHELQRGAHAPEQRGHRQRQAAFAVASLLAGLAVVTLVAKRLLESRLARASRNAQENA